MKTLADILWTIVRWLLPLTVAGLVVAMALSTGRIHEEVRRRIESRLREEFPALAIRVQAASLVEGEGIVARGVSFTDPALPPQYRQLVWIEELRLACGTHLADLATGPPLITAVHVRRPVVHAFRAADGRWPLAALARGGGRGLTVPVAVEDATLHVEDAASGARLVLRQIALQVGPDREAAGGAVVRGSVAGDLFERAGFEGRLTTADGGFALNGGVESLDLSPRLRGLLRPGGQAADWLAAARGRLDFSWRASGSLAALDAVDFAVTGRLEAGHVEHPRLPFAATNVAASFTADRAGVVCEQFTANAGSTLLRGSGRTRGWSLQSDFDLVVEAERLLVGRQWEGLLPEALVAHWSKLLPAGEVDVRALVGRRAGVITPDVSVRCRNLSLTYYRFPYRLDRTVGTVTFREGTVALHLPGQAGGNPVHVEGAIDTGTSGGPGFVEVRGDGMRIDDTLLAALPTRSADIVRSLRGSGTFDFVFRHDRSSRFAKGFANSLGIRLTQCSMSYAGFPYPLTNVTGSIRMEQGRWTIRDITGVNDTGLIRCSGALEPRGEDDGLLTLELAGRHVVLDPELRDALPSGVRRIWNDVDPQGTAEFTATVRHEVKQKRTTVELVATPEGDTVSIEPAWFPYRLERLRGSLAWRDGTLRFDGVRGVHARTAVTTAGTCRFAPDGGWHVSFDRITADSFRLDHDLLQALPEGLQAAMTGVQLRGLLAIDGTLDIYSTAAIPVTRPNGIVEQVPGPPAAAWNLQLDLEQAALDVGVPLEHVHGGLQLRGQSDGRAWQTVGELSLDSAICRGIQVTGVRGPISMDDRGARFGTPAATDPGTARRVAARVAGGTLFVDGSVAAGEAGGFAVSVTVADADLERIVGDVTGASHRYRGRLQGSLELAGSRAGAHALSGRGQVRLRDADLYELSVVVALLKMLRIKAPDRNAFTSSVVDFRIEGPHAYLDNIELSGDAISLVGAGEVDLDSNVNLTFRSIMGDSAVQLPAMKRMLGGASGQFMLIHVDGTLADPVSSTEAFPTLAAAIQQLQARRRGDDERLAGRPDGLR